MSYVQMAAALIGQRSVKHVIWRNESPFRYRHASTNVYDTNLWKYVTKLPWIILIFKKDCYTHRTRKNRYFTSGETMYLNENPFGISHNPT